jgi:hypothetical protein
VYVLAFAKTSPTAVEAIESVFGDMLRSAMSVARGYPWDVMAGAPEYEGSGYSRLATEVTKIRLRLFQSMCVSRFVSENNLGRAMTYLAQRWSGASTPVSMLHANDLRLLLPLNRSAPQAAHMFTSSGSLGYFLAVGWRCEPPAWGGAAIYGMMLGATGGDDTGLSDGQLASFQQWWRAARVMWVSELLQADWRTLPVKFHDELLRRAQNLEVEAIRLCTVAYGHGRTTPSHRRRIGLPTCAAWGELGVGGMVWRENAVCVIVRRGAESARVRVLGILLCDYTAAASRKHTSKTPVVVWVL